MKAECRSRGKGRELMKRDPSPPTQTIRYICVIYGPRARVCCEAVVPGGRQNEQERNHSGGKNG